MNLTESQSGRVLFLHAAQNLGLVDDHPDGVHYTSAILAADILQRICEILVQNGHIIDEIIRFAAIVETILQSPDLVIFDFQLPALDLSLFHESDQ